MASALTIQFEAGDYPKPLRLGVLGTDHLGRTVIARSAPLHEPITMAGLAKVAALLVRGWFEPELFTSAEEALHDLFESVTASPD